MARKRSRKRSRRTRSNLGILNLNATDQNLVKYSATAAISAVLVQKGFDWIERKSPLPAALKQPYALNAIKVVTALALLKTQRSELAKSAASGMIVSAVYDIGETVANKAMGLSGYIPAPRLSTPIAELPGAVSNNLSGYAPVMDSTGIDVGYSV